MTGPGSHRMIWTAASDALLIRMRERGASWDAIGEALMLCRTSVIRRGKELNAEKPISVVRAVPRDMGGEPLPAGHPVSWGAITVGTLLDGEPYLLRVRETGRLSRTGRFSATV